MNNKILEKQAYHVLALGVLLALIVLWIKNSNEMDGELFGLSALTWFWIALFTSIIHQAYVLLSWRGELYYSWFTNAFGKNAFSWHRGIFFILLLSRPIVILLLAIANRNTIVIPLFLYGFLIVLFGGLSLYTLYSVKCYFTLERAAGADHFKEEYKEMGLEKRGAFRFFPNAMYTIGLLLLWLPGIIFCSGAALMVALFHHLYVWVHYYTVEKPDMNFIYNKNAS